MVTKNSVFHRLLATCAVSAIAVSLGTAAARAQADTTDFDIRAQSLSEALLEFSSQSNVDVIAPAAPVDDKTAPAVRGPMTPQEALDRLLDGSGLTVRQGRDGSFVIVQAVPRSGQDGAQRPVRREAPVQLAQATPTQTDGSEQAAVEDQEMEEMVVTGFRRSLESALEVKRFSNSIVDSISSDGIGRFPDLNLGEALQRITGVQIERGERRRSEISIRGLPREFALTRVNGQAMASPDLRNAFAFGVFESSVFSGADVIKTPTAEMDDGGLSGIVNVKTLRPLEAEEDSLSVTLGTAYETLADQFTPIARARGNMKFTDQLAGAFSVAWSNQKFRRDVAAVTSYNDDDDGIEVANDFRYRVDTTEGDRISATGGLEWQPMSELTFGLNGVFTDYDQVTVRDQIRIRNCDDTAVETVGIAAVVSTHEDCRFEPETRERKDFDRTWAVTLDGAWNSGPWLAEGVVHYTRGRHDGNLIQMRRRINGAPALVTVNTGAGTPDDFQISVDGLATGDVATWSFDTPGVQTRFFPEGANNENIDTELALQVDVTREIDLSILDSVKIGFKYRDRKQESIDQDASNDDVDLDVLDDSIFRDSLISGSRFFGGNLQAFPLVVPDVLAVLDQVLPLDTDQPLNDEGFVLDQEFLATFDTRQDIYAGYFMANFDTQPLNLPIDVFGNAGVRVVHTERDTATFQEIDGEVSAISAPIDFTNVLPAVNMVFGLRENLLLRTSYTETIVRPNPDDFRAGTEVSLERDVTLESVEVRFNNPELEPFKSESIDVSLEWYNRPGSAITAAFFRKKIASDIIEQEFCPTDLAGFDGAAAFAPFVTGSLNGDLDNCVDEAGVEFDITEVFNTPETFTINGFEIGFLQNLDFLPAPFDGFGIQANYTYIDRDESGELDEDGSPAPLEEISEHTINVIAYYETELWGIRLAHNYRSEYFTRSNRGPSGGNRSIDDRHQLDLSINVNPTRHLSFGFEALNLNNARVYEFEGDRNRLRNFAFDGRTFVLIATYTF